MDNKQHSFTTTNPLTPMGPAKQLFVAGASVFEITDFTPPLQRVTILAINLPDPGVFGPFDMYVALLSVAGEENAPLAEIVLEPTIDRLNWVGTVFLEFGGTIPPLVVAVRPQMGDNRIGPVIMEGSVFGTLPDETPLAARINY